MERKSAGLGAVKAGPPRSVAALCLLLALSACAGSPPPIDPSRVRPAVILEESAISGIGEILMLEDHRRFDEPTLRRLADHSSEEVRRRAATAAGRIGDPAAAPLLLSILREDPRPAVRADAAFGLGELGDTSAAVVRGLRSAAPPRWRPVRPEETTVVVEIVAALAKLGTPEALQMLKDALRDAYPARDPHSRRIAAEALLGMYAFRTAPGRVTSVAPFLDLEDAELRWRAAWTLFRIREPAAVPHLVSRLGDEEHRVRAFAARGLSAPLADSAGRRAEALAALTGALTDRHPHVRINALGALATYAQDAPVERIAPLLRDPDPNVALAAAGALAALGEAGSTALREIADDQEAPAAVRAAAITGLAAHDAEAAWDLLAPWMEGGFKRRYLAARALAAFDWERAAAAFQRLARDEDRRVAIAAMQSAPRIDEAGESAGDAVRALLLEQAASEDPVRAAAALGALGPLLRPADVPSVLALYDRAHDHPVTLMPALAAIRALGALERREGGVAPAFFGRLRPARDPWIRRAAAIELGDGWGEAPPAVLSNELRFYTAIALSYVAGPLAGEKGPRAVIRTEAGEIELDLGSIEAPLTVHNFVELARAQFYDEGVWHRVIPNFVLQDGAPGGNGGGGPGWVIRDEINRLRYGRGVLGMALSGPDTGGSQWFITHSPQPHLDGGYTVFGRVTRGMEAADRVLQGDPIRSIRIRP